MTKGRAARPLLVAVALVGAAGCASLLGVEDHELASDASVATDAKEEAGVDAADAGSGDGDAATDTATGATGDATTDTATDATGDGTNDATPDVGTDAPSPDAAPLCGPWGCPVTLAAGDQSFDGGNPYFFPQAIAFLDGTLVFTDRAKVNSSGYSGGLYALDASADGITPLTALVADPENPVGLSASGTIVWWSDAKGFNASLRMLDTSADAGEIVVAQAKLGGANGSVAGHWLTQAFGSLWSSTYLLGGSDIDDIVIANVPRFTADAATVDSLFDAAVAAAAGNTPTNTSIGFATGPDFAIVLTDVYWTSTSGVWTCSGIDTGTCTPSLLYATPGAIAIATDGVRLYWTASNGVYWANPTLDGGGTPAMVSSASNCSLCLAIAASDPDHVYWSDGNTVNFGSADDAGAPLMLYKLPNGEDVQRLYVNGQDLYWTSAASSAPYGLVMKLPIR